MPQLFVTRRTGEQCQVEGESGATLMEALRNAGIDGILALCGGMCSCGTCHVYIDPACAGLLPPIGEDEDCLLADVGSRDARSRLACQLRIDERHGGLRLTIPPED